MIHDVADMGESIMMWEGRSLKRSSGSGNLDRGTPFGNRATKWDDRNLSNQRKVISSILERLILGGLTSLNQQQHHCNS
jgi:hypothetical protein